MPSTPLESHHPDIHWLAGLLEGEGSFLFPLPSSPNIVRITLESTDRDVVERAASILGGYKVYTRPSRGPSMKETYIVTCAGSRAMQWMKVLFPLMGKRRQTRIREVLEYMIWHASCRERRKAKDL